MKWTRYWYLNQYCGLKITLSILINWWQKMSSRETLPYVPNFCTIMDNIFILMLSKRWILLYYDPKNLKTSTLYSHQVSSDPAGGWLAYLNSELVLSAMIMLYDTRESWSFVISCFMEIGSHIYFFCQQRQWVAAH